MTERRQSPLTQVDLNPQGCHSDVRIDSLASAPMFAGLSVDELHDINARVRTRHLDAGEAVYHQGDIADRMFVLAAGAVKSVRLTADGGTTLLEVAGPGDYIGAVPALGSETYGDSVWTVSPTCLLGLDPAEYESVMETYPTVAMATLKVVSGQLSQARQSVHMLAGAPLGERLAGVVLHLADKAGRPWKNGVLIDMPLGRDDLAAMVGAASESVSRLLSAWRRDGIIDSGRKWIAVLDRPGLEALGSA